MSVNDEVTAWIEGVRQDDSRATQQLWEHYYQQLLQLAARRLPNNLRRDFDEEDVALSAFNSLCKGIAEDRFPDIADRDCLWALLIVITKRKCRARVRRHTAQKRGGGKVQGESAFNGKLGSSITDAIGREPTPEFASQMAEEVARLLEMLSDDVSQ
ncbi:MAG: DNA-directed RNA polymerase specialized sigma24 family protein, partial [Pirellulaceae bacterium]